MAQKVFSVYFTAELIRICEVSKMGNTVYVNRVMEEKMPLECFEDGMITDPSRLSQRIDEIFKDNRIKKGKLAFTISSRKIASKEIELPFMRNLNKIQEIIETNVSDYFPMSNPEDYSYKYKILEIIKNDDRKLFRLSLVAMPKEMIATYFDLAAKLKMPVKSIDYYANSINSILQSQTSDGVRLALQIEKDMTNVNIMKGKTLLFRRMIPFGSDLLIQNIAQELEISVEEANDVIKNPADFSLQITKKQYAEVVHDFVASITRVVEFHTNKNPDVIIDKGFIFGEGIGVPGLDEVLTLELGVKIIFAKKMAGVVVHKNNKYGLNYDELAQFLPNIGSIMDSLYFDTQESSREKEGEFNIFYVLIILAAVFVIGCGAFFLIMQFRLIDERKELVEQVENLQYAQDTYDTYISTQSDFNLIKGFYDSTKNSNEMLSTFFKDMEECIPESVGITNFSSQDGNVEITGEASSKEAIALYVIKLKEIEYIDNVRITSMTEAETDTGGRTETFNLNFNFILLEDSSEGGEQ